MGAILDAIMPYVALLVVMALFAIPGLWGAVFTCSLLGYLSQYLSKEKKDEDKTTKTDDTINDN